MFTGALHGGRKTPRGAKSRGVILLTPAAPGIGEEGVKSALTWRRVEGLGSALGVAAGLRHSVAVDSEGGVWGWGAGGKGQLGAGCESRVVRRPRLVEGLEGAVSVECGQYYTLVKTGGGLVGLGSDKYGQLGAAGRTVGQVACGWTHSLTLEEGVVRAWGRDNYSQLGGGAGDGRPVCEGVTRLAAGSEHSLVITLEGKVLAWGWNEHGNCGRAGEEDVPRPAPVSLPGGVAASSIWAGAAHNFALT